MSVPSLFALVHVLAYKYFDCPRNILELAFACVHAIYMFTATYMYTCTCIYHKHVTYIL